MKRRKTITIKNPLLKNLRNNLRRVVLHAVHIQWNKLFDEESALRFKDNKTSYEKKRKDFLFNKRRNLERAQKRSICECDICSKIDKDMTYNSKDNHWYCVDCYNELPKTLIHDWETEFPLDTFQINEFFSKLHEVIDQCRTDYSLSGRILKDMGINENDQKKFLDICEEYGGYCDCEIMKNAFQPIARYLGEQEFKFLD